MKSTLFILLALCFPTATDAFLWELLDPLWDFFAQAACNAAISSYNLDESMNCGCDGSFSLGAGLGASILCTSKEDDYCLVPGAPGIFCGQASLGANLQANFFSAGGGLSASITSCLDINSGLPSPLDSFVDIGELCITAVPGNGLFIASCSVTLGGEACQSCAVCDTQTDFTFDCSNINVAPDALADTITVPGPNIQTCIGLSLIPTGNLTTSGST